MGNGAKAKPPRSHPDRMTEKGEVPRQELQWKYVGNGTWAKTFVNMNKYITTSKGGPDILEGGHQEDQGR